MDAISLHKHKYNWGITFVIAISAVIPWNKQPFLWYYRNFCHHCRVITAAVGSSTAGYPQLPWYSRRPHYHVAL